MKQIFIFILLIILAGCQTEKIAVNTVSPERLKHFDIYSADLKGTVELSVKRDVFAEISGFIEEIKVHEGDRVKKGQELIIISNPDIENKYNEAESRLREAELNLSKVQDRFSIEEEKNELEKVQLEIALQDAEKLLTQTISYCQQRELNDDEDVYSAERSLKESENNYLNLEKDSSQVSQKEVDVKKKKIAKEEAEAELKRSKELFEGKIISKKQWEDSQNKYNKASLDYEQSLKDLDSVSSKRSRDEELASLRLKEWVYRYESAKKQAEMNKALNKKDIAAAMEKVEKCKRKLAIFPRANKLSPEDVEIAREKLRREEENVKFARENYLKTRIKSPVTGEIIFIDRLRTGGEVDCGTHCLVVGEQDKLFVKAHVAGKELSSVSNGQNVKISAGKENFAGYVKAIKPSANGMYEILIDFDTGKKQIKPYMYVDVKFISASREKVLVIPLSSVIKKNNISFVFLYDNGKIKEKEIKTGIFNKDYIEIISGLSEKDMVVLK
ncbi:MAG: HlyD family efflux transporter periplasmic adaptor subunit [Candidatus Eremiobacterota bacterium]